MHHTRHRGDIILVRGELGDESTGYIVTGTTKEGVIRIPRARPQKGEKRK